jgi:hypothetical protein
VAEDQRFTLGYSRDLPPENSSLQGSGLLRGGEYFFAAAGVDSGTVLIADESAEEQLRVPRLRSG